MAGAGLGVADVFPVGASATVDVVPPAGETWMIVSASHSEQASSTLSISDGTNTRLLIQSGQNIGFNTAGLPDRIVVDNADFLRFVGGSGSSGTAMYTGVKI